ncbi:MAG: ABC transporter substrate-binding protein [Oscillospiraceae bacterium]
MKTVKKLSAILLLMAIVLTMFAGCKKKEEATVIRFLNFKPEIAAKYSEIAKTYEKEKGIKVIVETAAEGTYESQLASKMSTSEAPTIFQINGPVGYKSWKDYCANLKDTDLYKHLTDKSLAVKTSDGVWGIPYVVEGYGIIYNDAIMNKYFALDTKKTSFTKMDEINSYPALKAVAEDMQANKAKLGIKGTFAATSLKSGDDWRWQTHLANVPISYEFEKNKVDLTSNAVKKINFTFSDNFKNIFDLYINNSTAEPKLLGSKIVDESMAEFALGQCAMVQNGNWAWGQISSVEGNTVKSTDIKYLPIYTGMEGENKQGLCIGTENFFCINSKATQAEQKAAEDFLYWLFSSEKGKDYVTNSLGFIAPFDTFKDNEKPKDPLAKEVIRWMEKDGVKTIPWNFTLFPSQKFKDDFGASLLQYAQGTKQWSEVKKLVVDEWASEWAAQK